MNQRTLFGKLTATFVLALALMLAGWLWPVTAGATTGDFYFDYIDEKGDPQKKYNPTILYGGNGGELQGGWYVVSGVLTVKGTLKLLSDVNIILTDGNTLTVEVDSNSPAITGSGSLTIYGQSKQTGKLEITSNDICVYLPSSSYAQYGGIVTMTSANNDSYSLYSADIKIKGGQLVANRRIGTENAYAGSSQITLGWTKLTDSIQAAEYSATVSVENDKMLVDGENHAYTGTLSNSQLTAMKGKVLHPGIKLSFDSNGGTGVMNHRNVYIGQTITVPGCGFDAPEGKKFIGWQITGEDSQGHVNSYQINPGDPLVIAKNHLLNGIITMIAQWKTLPQAVVETPPAGHELVYNGKAQKLVSAGKTIDGTMVYALGTADKKPTPYEWSESIPEMADAGVYTIWYKAAGDATHSDSKASVVTAKILPAYTIVSIRNGEHTQGDGKDLILIVKRGSGDEKTYELYTGTEVDGKALPEGSSTAEKGSLILSVKSSFLDSLSAGEHTVKVFFKDGSAETKCKVIAASVPEPKPTDTPKTGDTARPILWIVLVMLGLGGVVALPARIHRGRKK